MKKLLLAALIAVAPLSAAEAATLDFTDKTFSSVTHDFSGPIEAFSKTAAGVTFSFTATLGLFRDIGPWLAIIDPANAALTMGAGGGNVTSFDMVVDQDITLHSFSGHNSAFAPNQQFSVTGGSVSSVGNTFLTDGFLGTATPATYSFVGGPLSLTAGTTYSVTSTTSSIFYNSFLTAFDFSASNSVAVPVPAALPLLAGGLAGLGMLARRRKNS